MASISDPSRICGTVMVSKSTIYRKYKPCIASVDDRSTYPVIVYRRPYSSVSSLWQNEVTNALVKNETGN